MLQVKLDNHEGDQVLWCLKNYATLKLYYKLVHYRFHENQLRSSKIRVVMFPNSFESRRAGESIPKWSYYPTKHQSADSRKSNSNKAPNYGLLLMSIYSKPNHHNSFWQSTIIGSKAPCLFLSQTFSSPIESALYAQRKLPPQTKRRENFMQNPNSWEAAERLSWLGAVWGIRKLWADGMRYRRRVNKSWFGSWAWCNHWFHSKVQNQARSLVKLFNFVVGVAWKGLLCNYI